MLEEVFDFPFTCFQAACMSVAMHQIYVSCSGKNCYLSVAWFNISWDHLSHLESTNLWEVYEHVQKIHGNQSKSAPLIGLTH